MFRWFRLPNQPQRCDKQAKERAAGWADPTGGYIHAMHRGQWGGYHYRITGKNDSGEVTYEGGWQNNRKSGMHDELRMVEDIFEELDAPGEWFHDSDKHTLFYQPDAATDLAEAKVEVVRLRHLVEFQGSEDAPAKHITLQGFVIRHAARTFMDCNNVIVENGLSAHVWFNNSNDAVYSNIMKRASGGYLPVPIDSADLVDRNLYYGSNEAALKKINEKEGWDKTSLLGDPLFVDPANGDFRVKEGSPAFKIGFKKFPMDQFGVKKPSLKAIAQTPIIPNLNIAGPSDGAQAPAAIVPMESYWLGAKLHELTGEEFSAYGVTKTGRVPTLPTRAGSQTRRIRRCGPGETAL